LIANARMYAVTAAVAAQWRALFVWAGSNAGVTLEHVEHRAPAALHELWQRDDLGCAFMCGYPWATWSGATPRPAVLATVVPSPARYGGRSVYCTDIVVRADSDAAQPGDLYGRRFAYTTPSSQSGYQAPRAFFEEPASVRGGALFESAVGPLVTPRAVVDAVLANSADAGPLDSYWHDLLRAHEPATAARLRVVASTPMTPMPPLVCAAGVAANDAERLSAALLAAGTTSELRAVRDALLIAGFARPDPAQYAILVENARRADAGGYRRLQ
jgi:ABC-type phosphate/phosphonate transport system substrate-binding protein